MKVHAAIAKALIDNGIDTLFGLVGDANLFLVDSFVREYGGKFVSAAHEAGATLMALGYSAVAGKIGVVTVTRGPALVNTLTPMVEGVKGSLPIVLLCGDTAIEDRDNLQKVPQRELIVATGAGFEQLRSPNTLSEDIATALAERRWSAGRLRSICRATSNGRTSSIGHWLIDFLTIGLWFLQEMKSTTPSALLQRPSGQSFSLGGERCIIKQRI